MTSTPKSPSKVGSIASVFEKNCRQNEKAGGSSSRNFINNIAASPIKRFTKAKAIAEPMFNKPAIVLDDPTEDLTHSETSLYKVNLRKGNPLDDSNSSLSLSGCERFYETPTEVSKQVVSRLDKSTSSIGREFASCLPDIPALSSNESSTHSSSSSDSSLIQSPTKILQREKKLMASPKKTKAKKAAAKSEKKVGGTNEKATTTSKKTVTKKSKKTGKKDTPDDDVKEWISNVATALKPQEGQLEDVDTTADDHQSPLLLSWNEQRRQILRLRREATN